MKREVYNKIVEAMGLREGDLVIVQEWSDGSISDDARFLQAAIAAKGATPLLLMQEVRQNQMIFEGATPACFSDNYFQILQKADVFIDLMERPIGLLQAPLPQEKMALCGGYMQKLFAAATSCRKMLQLRVPTAAIAQAEGMDADEFALRIEAAMDIDYIRLQKDCLEAKKEYETLEGMSLRTGQNKEYELQLEFGDREWHMDAGDGDLPCGEVYIAPLEERTRGSVFFDRIYLEGENPNRKTCCENVVFTIEDGKVLSADHPDVQQWLDKLEEPDRVVCELGFGMNEHVNDLCGCTVLDEKRCGTFHIALGDNTMFGGKNEAEIHVDFVGKADIVKK